MHLFWTEVQKFWYLSFDIGECYQFEGMQTGPKYNLKGSEICKGIKKFIGAQYEAIL